VISNISKINLKNKEYLFAFVNNISSKIHIMTIVIIESDRQQYSKETFQNNVDNYIMMCHIRIM